MIETTVIEGLQSYPTAGYNFCLELLPHQFTDRVGDPR